MSLTNSKSKPELEFDPRFKAPPSVPPAVAQRLAASLDYMTAHLDNPIKISALSAMAGYSQARFFELFKQATGDTPLNWFIRARMRWAGEMLEKSNLQVKEVAARVGYLDPFYFSRVFKSVYGVSPSDYRVRCQGTNAISVGRSKALPAMQPKSRDDCALAEWLLVSRPAHLRTS